MDQQGWRRRPGDRVIRHPRQREISPVRVKLTPPRIPKRRFASPFVLMYGFSGLILVGWGLLMLPISNSQGGFTPWIHALFTATSAVTVTGLVVVNTREYWSLFGHLVILALIFIGGLGFMTGGTILLILIGKRITLANRLLLRQSLGTGHLGEVVPLIRNIFILAATIQLIGFAALAYRFSTLFPNDRLSAAWHGGFHAISAFNNAGFTIMPASDSMSRFAGEYYVLGIMATLIILGSVGYTLLVDLVQYRRFRRFTLDTRLVLVTTIILSITGTIAFLAFEFQHSLHGLPIQQQIANAFFQSVSGRTAGFSTVDFGATQQPTNFMYSALMFIGGASGSTAGGIKVNTVAVIAVAVLSSVRGRPSAEAFGRELPQVQVHRALAVLVLALLMVFGVALGLTVVEKFDFIDLLFETVSAFATTGLSSGITDQMTKMGQTILVITMFIGRLGPLTFALLLAQREDRPHAIYRYAQERVKIG